MKGEEEEEEEKTFPSSSLQFPPTWQKGRLAAWLPSFKQTQLHSMHFIHFFRTYTYSTYVKSTDLVYYRMYWGLCISK